MEKKKASFAAAIHVQLGPISTCWAEEPPALEKTETNWDLSSLWSKHFLFDCKKKALKQQRSFPTCHMIFKTEARAGEKSAQSGVLASVVPVKNACCHVVTARLSPGFIHDRHTRAANRSSAVA